MARTVLSESPEQTKAIGEELVGRLQPGSVVTLCGPLGSGKTTIVKGIARGLGIRDTVTSPSFTIVVEYGSPPQLVHVDLYRTSSDEELELLGFEEILSSSAVKVIEWGEKAYRYLPARFVSVEIRLKGAERREIIIREQKREHTCD